MTLKTDYRRVQVLQNELQQLLVQIEPDSEMKPTMVQNLLKISRNVHDMEDMPDDSADKVRLRHKNRSDLDVAQKELARVVQDYNGQHKKLPETKMSPEEQADRQKFVLLQAEIKQLYVKNLHESVRKFQDQQAVSTQRPKKRERKIDESHQESRQSMSQEEQEFMQEYAASLENQDKLLDEISQGMDELKQISLDMNKSLRVQESLLENLDTKIEVNQGKLKHANRSLKQIFQSDNACCVWTMRFILIIILTALVAYIASNI